MPIVTSPKPSSTQRRRGVDEQRHGVEHERLPARRERRAEAGAARAARGTGTNVDRQRGEHADGVDRRATRGADSSAGGARRQQQVDVGDPPRGEGLGGEGERSRRRRSRRSRRRGARNAATASAQRGRRAAVGGGGGVEQAAGDERRDDLAEQRADAGHAPAARARRRASAARARAQVDGRALAQAHRVLVPGERVAPGHDRARCRWRSAAASARRSCRSSRRRAIDGVTGAAATHAASPRYAARTAGSCSSCFASPDERDLAGLHHVAAVADFERELRVLLDQQDRHAFAARPSGSSRTPSAPSAARGPSTARRAAAASAATSARGPSPASAARRRTACPRSAGGAP